MTIPLLVARLNQILESEREAREQFRMELTPNVKVEFIAGEIIMHSPAKAKHLKATGRIFKLLDTFVALKGLGQVFTEKALITLTRNDYEPDIVFFGCEKSDQFHEAQMEFPAPDFVVEVLSSRQYSMTPQISGRFSRYLNPHDSGRYQKTADKLTQPPSAGTSPKRECLVRRLDIPVTM